MRPAGRCRPLSKASLFQADKRGLMSRSPASETHFQTGALRHASTRPRGNLLTQTGSTLLLETHILLFADLITRIAHECLREILRVFLCDAFKDKELLNGCGKL